MQPDSESTYLIRYHTGEEPWQELPMTEEMRIGRAGDCDLVLNSGDVSRYHANIKLTGDELGLMDLGSTNGTLIDGRLLPSNIRTRIQIGQEFQIGSFIIKVEPAARQESITETVAAANVTAEQAFLYNIQSVRGKEFPLSLETIYFDSATAAPLPTRSRNKIAWSLDRYSANPSQHTIFEGQEAYRQFQETLAAHIHAASPTEVAVITSCSAGLNAVAQALPLKFGDNIIFSGLEIPASAYPWLGLAQDGIVIQQTTAADQGLTLEAVQAAANSRTRVVAASSVQYFSGHRTDLAAIGKFCREQNILFVVDATQSAGHYLIDVQEMFIDVLVSGGEASLLAGPGIGFLYVRNSVSELLRPRLFSAYSVRSDQFNLDYDVTPLPGAGRFVLGTPPLLAIHGLLESMGLLKELTLLAIERHTTWLAAYTLDKLEAAGLEVITPRSQHGPIVTFKSGLDAAQTDSLLRALEERKMFAAAFKDKSGMPHVRLSFHCFNTIEEIDRFCVALLELKK